MRKRDLMSMACGIHDCHVAGYPLLTLWNGIEAEHLLYNERLNSLPCLFVSASRCKSRLCNQTTGICNSFESVDDSSMPSQKLSRIPLHGPVMPLEYLHKTLEDSWTSNIGSHRIPTRAAAVYPRVAWDYISSPACNHTQMNQSLRAVFL